MILKGLSYDETPLGKVTRSQVNDLHAIRIVGNQSIQGVEGATYTFTPAFVPVNTLHKNVSWSIVSGEQYATIDSENGTLTIIETGMVTIQCTSLYDARVYDTKDIMVTKQSQPEDYYIALINTSSQSVTIKNPVTLTVILKDKNFNDISPIDYYCELTVDNNCVTLSQLDSNTWTATYNSNGEAHVTGSVLYRGETYPLSTTLTVESGKSQLEIDQEKSQEYVRQNGFPQACGMHMFWIGNDVYPQTTYMGIITDTMSLVEYCNKDVKTNRIRIPIKVNEIPEGATKIRVAYNHVPAEFKKFGVCSFSEEDFDDWRNGDAIGNQNPIYDTGWIQAEGHVEEPYELDLDTLITGNAYGIVLVIGTDSLNHRLTYGEMENDIINMIDFIAL